MANSKELWGDGGRSFFTKNPLFQNDQIEAYGGFSFDVIVTDDKKLAIVLHITTRYVSPFTVQYLIQNRSIEVSPKKPLHCLYEMCQRWFPIEVTGILHTTVGEQKFSLNGHDRIVYDHTLGIASPSVIDEYKRKLSPSDLAITFRYPNKKMQMTLYAAASLARPKYGTEHDLVKNIHRKSILPPHKRITIATSYLKRFFQGTTLDGKEITFNEQPIGIRTKIFHVPEILGGNSKVLRIKNGNDYGVDLKDFGKERLQLFLKHGIVNKDTEFVQTYFLVPDTMFDGKGILDEFQRQFTRLISTASGKRFPIRAIPYQTAHCLTLREQFNSIKSEVDKISTPSGCLIILLPELMRPGLHDQLKKEYHKSFSIQCAKASSLQSYFEKRVDENGNTLFQVDSRKEGKYRAYIRNFVLGVLQVHRSPISCLNNRLHYDVHVGIDVLNDFWGFTFIYEGGKHYYFNAIQRPSSQKDYKEKIPKNKMYEMLYQHLKDHLKALNLMPSSLLIHRDGRSFDTEQHGAEKAIGQLKKENILSEDFSFGIVEIHKSSATKLRMVQLDGRTSQYENPTIGMYHVFGAFNEQAVLATTGYPFSKTGNNPYGFDGTALPVQIKLVSDGLNIEKVLEDIFNLSCLAWSALDKPSRLHLPIKLGDDFLEPIASKIDEEDFEEDSQEVGEEISAG